MEEKGREGKEGRERWRKEGKRRKRKGRKKDKRSGKFFTRVPNEPLHSLLHGLIPRTAREYSLGMRPSTYFSEACTCRWQVSPQWIAATSGKIKQSTWQLQENTNISSSLLSSPLISSSSSLLVIAESAVLLLGLSYLQFFASDYKLEVEKAWLQN